MKAWKFMVIVLFVLGLFVLPTIQSVSATGINLHLWDKNKFNKDNSDKNQLDNKNHDKDGKTNDKTCGGNEGFNNECQNFYNDSHYYVIEKWSFNVIQCKSKDSYKIDETNPLYSYFNIHVNGNLKSANWTSNPSVESVLVKSGNNVVKFNGGLSGSVTSSKDISHITFCGHKISGGDGGCTGADCGSNGVPEFPGVAVGAAVLVATLGLIVLRKN
jgi:hypothetical protein